jgi:ketosteroid isomerase-like protein
VRGVRYSIALPSERACQRRSLDERVFARFPGLYRRFADAWMRLPLRFRIRRLFLRRFVGRACAAANRRDFDLLVLGVDPGVEHHPAADLQPLDWDAVAHGHDGYQQVWRKMMDAFDDFRAEPAEVLDLGDRLLITAHYKGHGSGSGIPIDETLFQLCRLRRGLVVWQQDFTDRAEALEAAGLSE